MTQQQPNYPPPPAPTAELADNLTIHTLDGEIYLAVRNAEVRMSRDETLALVEVLCERIAEVGA